MALGAYRGMGSVLRDAIDNQEAEFIGLCATGESDATLRLEPGGFRFYPLWEQLSLPRRVRQLRPDYFLAPYNTAPLFLPRGVRLIMIVYDLIYMEPISRLPLSPSLYQNVGRFYRRVVVPRAVAKAERILTISEYSKSGIVSRLGVDPARITIIPCSIPDSWYVTDPIPLDARENYIFCVGGETASKNLPRAIEAYARSLAAAPNAAAFPELRIAGVSAAAQPRLAEVAQQNGAGGRVHFLPYLPLAELQAIYRGARLVFVPSLQEGFGIPLLEAMASGTPAVSSNATSLPEVGGTAPRYVDPLSVSAMMRGLQEMLSSPALQQASAEAGLRQAASFRGLAQRSYARFWRELAAQREAKSN
jgi:glycosyltransferase involved in cell wall biosynthesis